MPERSVAQRASVAGRVFEEVAVVALTPPAARPEITASLLGLVRREVVAPERSPLTLDEAYRFRHVLLRDAAYEALAKADRAGLHVRFADWLEQAAGDRRMEYQEILGYHLGQAYRYRVDLRENDDLTASIGARAATHLGAAGKRAADRGDGLAACRLLGQATALPALDEHAHVRWLVEFALALQGVGLIGEARSRAEDALRSALALGDRGLAARARVALVDLRQAEGTVVAFDPAIRSEIALALADADASGDHLALADTEDALARAAWNEGAESESEVHTRLAIDHATMAGEIRFALATELNLLVGVFAGETPASEVAAQAQALSVRAADYPTVRAEAISLLGISEAMLGRFEDAHRSLDESIALLIDLGAASSLVNVRTYKAWIHRLAGEWPAAEAVLRDALAEADAMGDLGFKSFVSCRLAEVLVAEERYDEAEAALVVAARSPVAATRSRISGAQARIKAARGDPTAKQEVEPLLAMTAGWPWPNVRAEALRDAAFVMKALGDRDAARSFAGESAALSRAKENLALAGQMDAFVRDL
jgi:predicted ATPase